MRAVLAAATLISAAGALSIGALHWNDDAAGSVVRAVSLTGEAFQRSGETFGWTAATLVVLLWIGRRFPLAVSRLVRRRVRVDLRRAAVPARLHRTTSISYRTGGRHGP